MRSRLRLVLVVLALAFATVASAGAIGPEFNPIGVQQSGW